MYAIRSYYVPDGQGQVSHFDLGSAERIEVLRGPFSVMHGNASGGVINVITRSGASNPGIDADFLVGSYGTWRAAMQAGGVTNGVDWLGSGSDFQTDGYREHSRARRTQAVITSYSIHYTKLYELW